MPTAQARPRSLRALPERRAQAISGIGQDAAEAHAGGADPVDLGQRDLGLGPVGPTVIWHPGTIEPGRIAKSSSRAGTAAARP